MAIETDLLIAAPMLQDYLVDKDSGFPLANGIVSLYKDNARTFYKNWYYQTGTPGAYTWIPLDNPLRLSSVGTIQDPNGNDVIPFYYPYQENNQNVPEAYYVTVYSADENGNPSVLQFTRENFPFQPSNSSRGSQNPTFRNYIINNVYWRNRGAVTVTNETDLVIAPSQHDGYVGNGDIRFIKDITGATDNIQFTLMSTTLENDITPEYYLNFNCSAPQVGEAVKCIQYPVSLHVRTLQNVEATLILHAQNVSGNSNNTLQILIYQYLGSGVLSQPDPILEQTITLSNDWERYPISFTFPDVDGQNLVLGDGGDDALFIRIQYPLGVTCNINHTKPQLYLSDNVPDNDFDTYDQINTVICSPRTGDFRTSLNDFAPYGWVACTGGTIGSSSSNSSYANQYTWPLYSLLWNKFANIQSNGSLYLPILTSAGAASTYGATAIADFSANKQLALTKTLGYVMAGGSVLNTPVTVTRSGNNLTTVSTFNTYFTGIPILLTTTGTLPAGLSTNTIYFCIYVNSTTIQVATTYANALAGTAIVLSDAGTGTHTVNTTMAGTYFGENFHTQTTAEMPAHTHPPSSGQTNFATINSNQGQVPAPGGGTQFGFPNETGSTGDGNAFNIVQQSVFYNVFLKL